MKSKKYKKFFGIYKKFFQRAMKSGFPLKYKKFLGHYFFQGRFFPLLGQGWKLAPVFLGNYKKSFKGCQEFQL